MGGLSQSRLWTQLEVCAPPGTTVEEVDENYVSRRAASIAATLIFVISITASNAHFASVPVSLLQLWRCESTDWKSACHCGFERLVWGNLPRRRNAADAGAK